MTCPYLDEATKRAIPFPGAVTLYSVQILGSPSGALLKTLAHGPDGEQAVTRLRYAPTHIGK